ncbi:MAG: DsrE family protein [Candidatus Bathyarchaeota archaeon]|nr:DsrE family protein [Candidatus Bathyarchaeota archaeon]
MSGKLLFVILSGPDNPNRVRWGLRMALNTYAHPYGERVLDEVKVLLFCSGVSIVDPGAPSHEEFRKRLQDLREAGVEVASCVSIADPLGLVEGSKALGIKLVHASVYVAERVSEGYTVMTF